MLHHVLARQDVVVVVIAADSDRTLKMNIVPMETSAALAKVAPMGPYSYEFKDRPKDDTSRVVPINYANHRPLGLTGGRRSPSPPRRRHRLRHLAPPSMWPHINTNEAGGVAEMMNWDFER